MLFVCIPNDELKGQCRINGEPKDFEIDPARRTFAFRPAGSDAAWDRRQILDACEGATLTNYVCADSDGSGVVMFPEMDAQGNIRIKKVGSL
jgi:hypothetical protein